MRPVGEGNSETVVAQLSSVALVAMTYTTDANVNDSSMADVMERDPGGFRGSCNKFIVACNSEQGDYSYITPKDGILRAMLSIEVVCNEALKMVPENLRSGVRDGAGELGGM
ncbi:hypothetical protein TNIN_383351 [Trichonephila inaurata madagascariensis]|uniref:Uncharacterized protein n=1 Tax=Trichonephila inaurata madagascariensis TaxID=2747483 RepID=A0A8X7C5L8_9ARAC|nr:hypothetical protein TNIN_383351 [Trichonephila inaurata madagascariensis]